MSARIAAVTYFLPGESLTNDDLAEQFPECSVDKIAQKTGIRTRRIAGPEEFSSDLAIGAGRALFEQQALAPADIEYLIVCTQSPDFFLPSTACIVQDALGLPLYEVMSLLGGEGYPIQFNWQNRV